MIVLIFNNKATTTTSIEVFVSVYKMVKNMLKILQY